MKEKFDNHKKLDSDKQTGDIAQDFILENHDLSEGVSEEGKLDENLALTSADPIISSHTDELPVNDKLGDFTDKTLAEGVIRTGILGDLVAVNGDDETNKELDADDIKALNNDEEQSELPQITANEFDEMTNLIDGKVRKPRKKKKKKTKVRKIVVRTYVTIFIAIFCIVGIYYGVSFTQAPPTQGMEGAELRVDMADLPHIVGTEGEINLELMFPNAKDFKSSGSKITNNILKITSLEPFKLSYTETVAAQDVVVEKDVEVLEGAVNVADWETFISALDDKKVICIQTAYLAAPPMEGTKKDKMSGLTLKNDIYGNGCKLNMFEIVTCRNKFSGGKVTKPYLQGKGPVGGWSAFYISAKDDGSQIVMQDLHIIGNDMSTAEDGNLAGVSEVIIQKRGLKLFSGYGTLLAVEGNYSSGNKANFMLKHCVLENSHKLIHVRYADMDFEGNIIRNASDTALSIATYANERSVVVSRNNVIANSLTGGVVFYCYDSAISSENASDSWNEFRIVDNTFLDIFNWKMQDSLAFMPETEGGAEIANPVAKSEIPKSTYDALKADIDGKKYIHFAIIKLRTGNGLAKNGSIVKNYQALNYKTSRDKGYPNGFPLPKIAAAIIKDIDVWGYYEKDSEAVKPTDTLDSATVERLYGELKFGRTALAK